MIRLTLAAAFLAFRAISAAADTDTTAPAFRVLSVERDDTYTSFMQARDEGWLGSDVIHSIPLGDGRILWLYGDTFVGRLQDGRRATGAAFINSSIGIQSPADPRAPGAHPGTIEFFWGTRSTDEAPASFFPHQPGTPGNYYWVTNGIMLRGELYLWAFSMNIVAIPRWIDGSTLIRVPNPLDPPADWKWSAVDFGLPQFDACMHSAVYVDEPHVYFMGPSGGAMRLARMETADLTAGTTAPGAMEYWVESPDGETTWSRTPRNPDRLAALFKPGVTETHVQHEPAMGLYFVTTYSPHDSEILLTAAPAMTGPWSDPVPVYNVPEHDQVSFPIISYAARPHPELATAPGEIVISYATNSHGAVAPVLTPEGLPIYQPRFIRVRVAKK